MDARSSAGISSLLAGVTTSALAVMAYAPTLAPTISWRNGGADSGELAAAVSSMGVPHPPGYPTYLLLGWLWTALPLGGDVAYRLNALSATGAALAAGMATMTVCALGARAGVMPGLAAIGGALGGLAFALTPLMWSQATVTEVYAPGLAMLGAVTLLLLTAHAETPAHVRALTGLLGGLSLGMLPQVVLIGPGAALLLVMQSGWRGAGRGLMQVGGGAALGLSVFAVLPWRAASDPLVNWSNPTTLASFWALVSADAYRPLLGSVGWASWATRVLESVATLAGDLGWVCLGLAAWGALAAGARNAVMYLLCMIALTVAFRAAYPADGNAVYLLPALYGVAVLAGCGLTRLLASVAQRHGIWAPMVLTGGCAALLIMRAQATAADVDVSRHLEADAFGRHVMATLPPGALVVSEHDETTFALWYRQAQGERPDVIVVDARLLTHPWYQAQLVRRNADLPAAAVRPGGLTAVDRPVYILVGEPLDATLHPAVRPGAPRTSAAPAISALEGFR